MTSEPIDPPKLGYPKSTRRVFAIDHRVKLMPPMYENMGWNPIDYARVKNKIIEENKLMDSISVSGIVAYKEITNEEGAVLRIKADKDTLSLCLEGTCFRLSSNDVNQLQNAISEVQTSLE